MLSDGRDAFDRSEWRIALDSFQEADAEQPLAVDDLARAAVSALWAGERETCIEYRQRVFTTCVGQGDNRRAAVEATELCHDHAGAGRMAVAIGWLQRAERL